MNEVTLIINSEGVPAENRIMYGNVFAGVIGEVGKDGTNLKASILGEFNLITLLRVKAQLNMLSANIDEYIADELSIMPADLFTVLSVEKGENGNGYS